MTEISSPTSPMGVQRALPAILLMLTLVGLVGAPFWGLPNYWQSLL